MDNQLFYPHIHWNAFNKFLLRFTIVFFGVLILSVFSFFGENLYPWVAQTFFSINKISFEQTGSGDMMYHYIDLFVCFSFALITSIIWSFFNKKEKGYDTLLHYFIVFCRYFVGGSLLLYGYSKIFYNQFGDPGITKLVQPFGESTPMGVAWSFMGVSKAYTMFSGAVELTGGVLLLFRRTSLMGAIFGFAVMLNVMMMNYCYDIPVKLYSTQLVIMSFIILCVMGHNLKLVLLKNAPTEPVIFKPLFTKKWLKITRLIFKTIVVITLIVVNGYFQYGSIETNGPDAPKAPLYGLYKPTQLIKNNDTLRVYSDSAEWKYLILEREGIATVRQLNDRTYRLTFNVDTLKKTVTTSLETDTLKKYQLSYSQLNDTMLQLKGVFIKDTINFTFGKVNLKSFRLKNCGFKWINEYPNSR